MYTRVNFRAKRGGTMQTVLILFIVLFSVACGQETQQPKRGETEQLRIPRQFCERCARDDTLRHLRAGGAGPIVISHPGKAYVRWTTRTFGGGWLPLNLRKKPQIAILEKRIEDDLGTTYDLDMAECWPEKAIPAGAWSLRLGVLSDRIPAKARKLEMEIVFSANGQKFHIQDTLLRNRHPRLEWASEYRVRRYEEHLKRQKGGE